MSDINQLQYDGFRNLCRQLARGLGMEPKIFSTQDRKDLVCIKANIERQSTQGDFSSRETWLCAFFRSPEPLEPEKVVPALVDVVAAAQARYFLLVPFNGIAGEAEDELREKLARESVQAVVLSPDLGETLVQDYAREDGDRKKAAFGGFSFVRLRNFARTLVQGEPWRDYFQTPNIQPAQLTPLHQKDRASAEADFNQALQEGSFLLLGDPGAGKTTGLIMLAEELARSGGLTPVLVPLGRYRGNFWELLRTSLAPESEPVSHDAARALMGSGAVALLLDGINEVQDKDMQNRLAAEINELTEPDSFGARCRWIVSGRIHDYEQSRFVLKNLEKRRWEMRPFDGYQIYQVLAKALGEEKGKALYEDMKDMGGGMHELCSNPLLLNMTLAVFQKTGKAPAGRMGLYRQFILQLLKWSERRGFDETVRQKLLGRSEAPRAFEDLIFDALTDLAASMTTTRIQWGDARRQLTRTLPFAEDPETASQTFLQELTRCGLLRIDAYNGVFFHHHTFQEFFQARALREKSPEDLIPSGGVSAEKREAALFAAAMADDPGPFIQRALDVDLLLAYEITRDAFASVPEEMALSTAL